MKGSKVVTQNKRISKKLLLFYKKIEIETQTKKIVKEYQVRGKVELS